MAAGRRKNLLRDLFDGQGGQAYWSGGPNLNSNPNPNQANLPGSTRERDLLTSFSRMVSELLRHSDRSEVCEQLPERLRLCHRPKAVTRDDAPVVARSKAPAPVRDLFGGADDSDWALAPLGPVSATDLDDADAEDLLASVGF